MVNFVSAVAEPGTFGTVGYQNAGVQIAAAAQIFQKLLLGGNIQAGSCFVQQEQGGFAQKRPGNGQALSLSFRDAPSAGT